MGPFGGRVVGEKRDLVFESLERFLVRHPKAKGVHKGLGLRVYPISRTPFVVLYVFDDQELRVHFILHRRASLKDLDQTIVEW